MLIWIVAATTAGVALSAFLYLKYSGQKMQATVTAGRNLRGKIAIITGASSGLGREVAFQLAKRQMEVVLACRDRVKTEKAIEFIENRLKKEQSIDEDQGQFGKLHAMDLDLVDLRSVDSFVTEFVNRFDRLHLLINNAGVMACPYGTSRGGFIDLQFAINHLGHFHLTNSLLPILKRSAPSRILIVTSGYYRKLAQGSTADDFSESSWMKAVASRKEMEYDPTKAYSRSKLANCLHSVELAKRLANDDVQVFTIRPGFVRGTELGRHFNRFLVTLASPLIWMFSQSVEQGAQTYLHCATAEIGSKLKSGGLFYNCAPQTYLESLVNDENARILWKVSERLVSKEQLAIDQLPEWKEDKDEAK